MNEYTGPFTKINNRLFRSTQCYLDRVLAKYEISSGNYVILLIIYDHKGISQNALSREMRVDKAFVAREIKKLEERSFVRKLHDEKDTRANNLYLTDKAIALVPKLREEINKWNEAIMKGLSEEEKHLSMQLLHKILLNSEKYKEMELK